MVDANGQEITSNPASWGAAALRWLFGQEAVVVVVVTQLSVGMYGFYLLATKYLPEHDARIQNGVREISIELQRNYIEHREREIAAETQVRKEYRELLLRGAGVGAADAEEMGLLR